MSNEEDIKAGKKYPNITEEQRESIINFFEKYWELLCNNKDSKPKVALIPKKIVEGNKFLWNNFTDYKKQTLENNFFQQENQEIKVNDHIKDILFSDDQNRDARFEKNININNISIVDLPDYNKIMNDQIKQKPIKGFCFTQN